jgi:hypothetical protein
MSIATMPAGAHPLTPCPSPEWRGEIRGANEFVGHLHEAQQEGGDPVM